MQEIRCPTCKKWVEVDTDEEDFYDALERHLQIAHQAYNWVRERDG